MASLSETLLVEVKSIFQSEQHSDGYLNASRKIRTVSELPLLGVTHFVADKKGEYYCVAYLDSERSLSLYQAELQTLYKKISQLDTAQKQQQNNKDKRYRLLLDLLANLEQYEKYYTVARLLGAQQGASLPTEVANVRLLILSIESAVPSLEVAAQMLTRDLPAHTYYVQPPLPYGSQQATKLSRLMRDTIKRHIKSTDNNGAQYILKGSYEILKDGISVTYKAVDDQGSTIATRVSKLASSAYQNIEYKPQSIDFNQLLHNGYVVSNDFKAELNTNLGNQDLLFVEGQSIELFVKLNQPGYFYVVSHNTTDNSSYLLELSEATGKRAFIRYVNADDANRWLSLGEFEAAPPFGTENLQLVASSQDLVNNLPEVLFDNQTELYFVQSRSTQEAVTTTRALKPKKSKSVKAAESTLSFTTMEK